MKRPFHFPQYILLLPAALLLVRCLGDASQATEDGLSRESGNGSLHAIMSEQLTVGSTQLNALLFDLHRTETVLSRERRRQIAYIGATARNLEIGAGRVRELAPTMRLPATDFDRFTGLATQLEAQAGALGSLAESGQLNPEQFETILADINTTCNACHGLYRDNRGARR